LNIGQKNEKGVGIRKHKHENEKSYHNKIKNTIYSLFSIVNKLSSSKESNPLL
jgi:hypothetical protein